MLISCKEKKKANKLTQQIAKIENEVHNPEHYKIDGLNIEVVDVIRAVLTDEEFKGWCKGNILKYLMRAGKKDKSKEKQDFAKAGVFISWLTD